MAHAPPDRYEQFYVVGGNLHPDAPSYVRRHADDDLYDALSRGEFCYILTSRQMGKSSLIVRTGTRLAQDGVHVVTLDLTGIGQNLTPEQWYSGLLLNIGERLDLEDELDDFWEEKSGFRPCSGLWKLCAGSCFRQSRDASSSSLMRSTSRKACRFRRTSSSPRYAPATTDARKPRNSSD